MLWLVSFGVVVGLGCAGEDGVDGIAGAAGADGTDGTDGTDGVDFPGPVPAAYTAADGIAGGTAYSKWWATDAGGSGTPPTTTVAADFYRCKACHGWDGMGNAASYATRTGQSTLRATRPDVSSINLRATVLQRTYQGLFDLIQRMGARDIDAADNTHPDFSMDLMDDQVWNIVKFMREEWVEPNLLYDIEVSGPAMYVDYTVAPPVVVAPTITYSNIGALGDEANGQTIYADLCATCHGADGTTVDIEGNSLGQYLRLKPYEVWHKAKFGEPGFMDSGLVTDTGELQDLYKALTNTTNFPDMP
jgi:cytochrome c553